MCRSFSPFVTILRPPTELPLISRLVGIDISAGEAVTWRDPSAACSTMGIRQKEAASRCRTTVRAAIHELITAPITAFERQSPTLHLT
jgi:hypothetical protein